VTDPGNHRAGFEIRDADRRHMAGVAEIYNHAVRDTFSIWSEATTTPEQRIAWMEGRRAAGFPVLVALDSDHAAEGRQHEDGVLGYASFGVFRDFPGYIGTVEHSVYVAVHAQRRGVGRALLSTLVGRARARGLSVMVGGVDSRNAGSLALHASLGFEEQGRLKGVGRKFGQSLDLVFMVRAV
jgi:L-amino acid N-acyltransferase